MSREAESKKAEQELTRLRKLPENKQCANCQAPGMPLLTAVVMPFKIFVCSSCKSAHQSFSHRCKSAQMSFWTLEEVRSLEERSGGGNKAAQERYLRYAKDSDRPREGDSDDRIKDFVRRAYIDLRWAAQDNDDRERGGGRDRDRGRVEEEPDRREADRRRDRGGGTRSGRGRDEDLFDPDSAGGGGGRGSGGGRSAAPGASRPAVKEVDFFNPDAAPTGSAAPRGAPANDLFDPDGGSAASRSYTASPAEAGFNPDAPASFNPSAPAAAAGTPFNAFASGPQPPQPWAASAQAAGPAPAAGGLMNLNFSPTGGGPAPAAAPAAGAASGGFDLFGDFVSAAPAAAPQQPAPTPQAAVGLAPMAAGCGAVGAPMMGGQAAWGSAGASPMGQPNAAAHAAMGQQLPCGAGGMQGAMGMPAVGMSMQGQQPGQWGSSAQGGVPPHPALSGGMQPGGMQPGWQQQGFAGGAAWHGGGCAGAAGCAAAQVFGGVGQQAYQQQAMHGGWGQPGAAWPAQQCPQGLHMQAQLQQQQQQQQPVRLEDLKQNLNQLYAAA
mmetsp:Transcript_32956/g.98112  ORF Transcript_32956/g.98112 Transcript_32956/m.98112 type:complete len:551 (-) Transcript_32956:49-1701(-)